MFCACLCIYGLQKPSRPNILGPKLKSEIGYDIFPYWFYSSGKSPQQIVAKGLVSGSLMFDASDKQAFYEYGKYARFYKKDKNYKDIW